MRGAFCITPAPTGAVLRVRAPRTSHNSAYAKFFLKAPLVAFEKASHQARALNEILFKNIFSFFIEPF